ncbi:hypothetical protein [Pseudomonas sp. MF4836]|uniref:hypothetical protein n=1 Tax=Pseudomonas sp. MF4836 TaxID=1960827 RepID=UPI0009978325|nr:hypothetical protein [Pseudomonas sp. MF4836]OOW00563.1 hypothetical protein MF4836_01235 [Pseudomonas sp. MF4836]
MTAPSTPALYQILDPDLLELLTWDKGNNRGFSHWPSGDNNHLTYGLMTWLVMRALKVERFPWHPDSRAAKKPDVPQAAVLNGFLKTLMADPAKLDRICQEILTIKLHTWWYLRPQRTILLSRSISGDYAALLYNAHLAATQLELSHFWFPVDGLTSWGTGSYPNNSVVVKMEIDVDDIVWVGDIFQHAPGSSSAGESGEYVVMNRACDGRMKIPTRAVSLINSPPEFELKNFAYKHQAKAYLKQASTTLDAPAAIRF